MDKNLNPIEFVMAITDHRVFGHILAPYLVRKNRKGTFYETISLAKTDKNQPNEFPYTDVQICLIGLYEKYSDENLTKKFSRKQVVREFFDNLEPVFFQKYIAPYIDKQISESIALIEKHNVRIFQKPAKYSNLYEEDLITVMPGFATPVFHFELSGEGLTYSLKVEYIEGNLPLLFKKPVVLTDSPAMLILENKLYRFRKVSGKKLAPFFEKSEVKVPPAITEKYMRAFVYNIIRDFEVRATGFTIEVVQKEKKAILSIERGLDLNPMLVLMFQYGRKRFLAGNKSEVEVEFHHEKGAYTFLKHIRDFGWEQEMTGALKQFGMKVVNNQLEFIDEQMISKKNSGFAPINWINTYSAQLARIGFLIEQSSADTNYFTGEVSISLTLKTEGDWFDLYAIVHFGDYQFPFIRLKKNILKGERTFVLPNGEVVILPEVWFSRYREIARLGEPDHDVLKFQKYHFSLLEETLQGTDPAIEKKLSGYNPSILNLVKEPPGIGATLRNYQKQGFSWMYSLHQHRFGGCLADDMGLGKTLQTLTLLLKLKEENSTSVSRFSTVNGLNLLFPIETANATASLIIVPTSLVHNWYNEIRKFTPGLKVYQHVGSQRKRDSGLREAAATHDVILTSYGIVRNDYPLMLETRFNFIILDESQYIKNSGSKTYQSVCALQSEHRLVLTGTPIENSLSDLWAQMNFLNPGLLGNLSFFQNEFIQTVEKGNDDEKQRQLKKMIAPFILRRKKEEVETDLPPLTQLEHYCEMTEEQERIYEEQKSIIRNSILESIEKQGVSKSSFLALQGLTRLRQLANHPILLNHAETGSGKFSEVLRTLEELMAESHKVLVFSSFVTHLKLFEQEFQERGWAYCFLSGKTRDRETVISEFQEKTEKRIFLISLKAGGVGLNLTSADYIFILDPWWNPAAENQAVSRAHRIGQNKKVFVYRFITEGSIEEKIQKLKERKSALAEKFINSSTPFETLSADEIIDLFS